MSFRSGIFPSCDRGLPRVRLRPKGSIYAPCCGSCAACSARAALRQAAHRSSRPCPIPYENPVLTPPINRDFLWDQLVDVVDDYFEIEREDRVRLVDNMLTLGRIETVPELSATLLEPWKRDSVGYYQRLESTLQTMRRQATVQVVPTENGYLVDVTVYKYLEDLRTPENNQRRRFELPQRRIGRSIQRSDAGTVDVDRQLPAIQSRRKGRSVRNPTRGLDPDGA